MALFDLILNLAALLLWLGWCSRPLDPLARTTPATIIGTVKRAEPHSSRRWPMLSGLALLLALRAFFYFEVGSAVDWTPKLNLSFVVLAFRSDLAASAFLYSLLSFARVWVVYYFWLLTVVWINRRTAEPDPLQRLFRLHLGWVRNWPWPALTLLPVASVTALWLGVHPLLEQVGVVTRPPTMTLVVEQALLLALALVLSLKYLLPVFLLLDLVTSYVYFGTSPVWDFVTTTSRNILRPLKPLPLRLAKIDLAPLLGTLLILAFLHWLPQLIHFELSRRKLPVWPQ